MKEKDMYRDARDTRIENEMWGHDKNIPTVVGERRWGVKADQVHIEFDGVETVPFGTQAAVINMGTPQKPRLRFYIPQGMPGTPAPQGRGMTDTFNGIDVENGLVVGMDRTLKSIRMVSGLAKGGVDVDFELSKEGLLKLEVDSSSFKNDMIVEFSNAIDQALAPIKAELQIGSLAQFKLDMHTNWAKTEGTCMGLHNSYVELEMKINILAQQIQELKNMIADLMDDNR